MLLRNINALIKNATFLCDMIALVMLNCRINCHLIDIWQLGAKLFFDELFSVHDLSSPILCLLHATR
ncbi:hypothetical protein VIP0019 [Salmonella phage Vi II-E1]|uniref:Hypothetical phage protein n=1 Tax=Salmonella phage Vi II-E1 TaxID=424716 RepID=B1GS75_9CAUD|nr:hypothetical protein VIP0019 [Salmonella phage Vi II-E1]CAM33124.1 hypothetical phage protein [Salmonella phage Vi II-E1]